MRDVTVSNTVTFSCTVCFTQPSPKLATSLPAVNTAIECRRNQSCCLWCAAAAAICERAFLLHGPGPVLLHEGARQRLPSLQGRMELRHEGHRRIHVYPR